MLNHHIQPSGLVPVQRAAQPDQKTGAREPGRPRESRPAARSPRTATGFLAPRSPQNPQNPLSHATENTQEIPVHPMPKPPRKWGKPGRMCLVSHASLRSFGYHRPSRGAESILIHRNHEPFRGINFTIPRFSQAQTSQKNQNIQDAELLVVLEPSRSSPRSGLNSAILNLPCLSQPFAARTRIPEFRSSGFPILRFTGPVLHFACSDNRGTFRGSKSDGLG
jgi:hypothetical protein